MLIIGMINIYFPIINAYIYIYVYTKGAITGVRGGKHTLMTPINTLSTLLIRGIIA